LSFAGLRPRTTRIQWDNEQVVVGPEANSRIIKSLTVEGNTLPIVFVRYNPHEFKIDGQTERIPRRAREASLLRHVNAAVGATRELGLTLSILYMYYDTVTVDSVCEPQVLKDPEYNSHMAECCLPSIEKIVKFGPGKRFHNKPVADFCFLIFSDGLRV
jgi:hypothetical protein